MDVQEIRYTLHLLNLTAEVANDVSSKAYQVLSDPVSSTSYRSHPCQGILNVLPYRTCELYMTGTGSQWLTKKVACRWRMLQLFLPTYLGETVSLIMCDLIPYSTALDQHDDTQIGEISLMKEMTSVATTMMTDDEKADIERELKGKGTSPAVTPSHTSQIHGEAANHQAASSTVSNDPKEEHRPEAASLHAQHSSLSVPKASSPTPSTSSKEKDSDPKEMKERRKQKPTPEQKEKLEALEKERRGIMEKRVKELHRKLVERYEISTALDIASEGLFTLTG